MDGDAAALQYIDDAMASVEGWFDFAEARAFVAVHRTQAGAGTTGDLLEVGAYLGKGSILLGYLLQPGERLVAADLFGVDPDDVGNQQEVTDRYSSYTLDGFRRNFARFHDWTPEILVGPSATTLATLPSESCRLIHVDGSHLFDGVAADIAEAQRLLGPGGIVIFDDMFSPHTPGVQAAVWKAVADGLVPIAVGRKLYATWTPETFDVETFRRQLASTDGVKIAGTQRISGHDVITFARDLSWHPPSWDTQSKLRRRLALLVPPAVPRLVEAVDRRRHGANA